MGKSRLDLSALDLKLLAMAAMLVDHMGYLLFPTAMWMRYVGRLAFPIFAFQIAEGWYRTHDREKYTLRLLICAVVSEVPFDLAFSGTPGIRMSCGRSSSPRRHCGPRMPCRSGCAFPCPWRRCRPQGRAICWANGCRRTISAPGC